jgi:hypothetical protein
VCILGIVGDGEIAPGGVNLDVSRKVEGEYVGRGGLGTSIGDEMMNDLAVFPLPSSLDPDRTQGIQENRAEFCFSSFMSESASLFCPSETIEGERRLSVRLRFAMEKYEQET